MFKGEGSLIMPPSCREAPGSLTANARFASLFWRELCVTADFLTNGFGMLCFVLLSKRQIGLGLEFLLCCIQFYSEYKHKFVNSITLYCKSHYSLGLTKTPDPGCMYIRLEQTTKVVITGERSAYNNNIISKSYYYCLI